MSNFHGSIFEGSSEMKECEWKPVLERVRGSRIEAATLTEAVISTTATDTVSDNMSARDIYERKRIKAMRTKAARIKATKDDRPMEKCDICCEVCGIALLLFGGVTAVTVAYGAPRAHPASKRCMVSRPRPLPSTPTLQRRPAHD